MTDEELMRQVVAGQEDALIELHRRYVNLVYSMAYRVLKDGPQAEESTQDVFMKVWQRASQYDPARGGFKNWLLTVSRRTAIDRLRKVRRRIDSTGIDNRWPELAAISGSRRAADQAENLRDALGDLPHEQRQALGLAYFGGMSQSEIAKHLDVPLGTVKTRIRLGMDKLRAALTLAEGKSNV